MSVTVTTVVCLRVMAQSVHAPAAHCCREMRVRTRRLPRLPSRRQASRVTNAPFYNLHAPRVQDCKPYLLLNFHLPVRMRSLCRSLRVAGPASVRWRRALPRRPLQGHCHQVRAKQRNGHLFAMSALTWAFVALCSPGVNAQITVMSPSSGATYSWGTTMAISWNASGVTVSGAGQRLSPGLLLAGAACVVACNRV